MARSKLAVASLAALAVITGACSGSMNGGNSNAPTGVGGGGGGGGGAGGTSSATVTASSTTTGGDAYGMGGNYFFSPTPDTVAAGTTVTFQFGTVTHNVTFTPVANAPADIPPSMSTSVQRTFSTAGTYNYTCTIHGFSGVMVVH